MATIKKISGMSSITPTYLAGENSDGTMGSASVLAGSSSTNSSSYSNTVALRDSVGALYASAVHNAVWNDLVDCIEVPEGTELDYGYCYALTPTSCEKTSKRAQKGAILAIHSNTAGFIMGEKANKPTIEMALAGFVLAYVDKIYKTGTPLTCTKNGYLTKMNWFERLFRRDALVGYFYKEETEIQWHTIDVSGRYWVKIK